MDAKIYLFVDSTQFKGIKLLVLYNSMTGAVEPFEALENREVKMFTCGPSIYQRPHIGNYRTFVFEDILQRYLEYLGYRVIRALNFTDIEDKSIEEAQKRNMDVLELTQQYADIFYEDIKLLKIEPPTCNPRSSTSVDRAVLLIQELLKKGHAYWYKGNVYFDPLTFEGFGKLAHLDMSRWPRVKRRFHRDTYPGDRWNRGDFIIWRGYKEGAIIYWDTAIGRGAPAWNIQDAAMLLQTLGLSIDILAGGEDNLVRHHDYIIATTEPVSGRQLARYWLHCAHLLVNGKKMSKSRGNIIYIDDLQRAGYTGEEIRFFLVYGHYKKKLDFSHDRIKKTSLKLKQAYGMINTIRNLGTGMHKTDNAVNELIMRLKRDFEKNMDNDLNVKPAFDSMLNTLSGLTELAEKSRVTPGDAERITAVLKSIDRVLQVFGQSLI
ncbi:cysteinyl-tRNA synthetase [Candidatus Methanoperedens nitroreducens]|uniref:Cysteinyl-tRNA synthetase n=1 Tax=Candidatus Methanoperedens nitratireducens TaxID=1392998 RepID=A0A062V243_9EURY|nr:cysteinyl-tRNA synthetase [Candidatus Methanoperedens nitroreducens]